MTTQRQPDWLQVADNAAANKMLVRNQLLGDGVAMFFVEGDPNGAINGVANQLALDVSTGVVYQNTDNATEWSVWAAAGGPGDAFAYTNVPLSSTGVVPLVVSDAARVAVFNVDGIAGDTRLNLPDTATVGTIVVIALGGTLAHVLTVSCDANQTRPADVAAPVGASFGSVAFVYNGDNNWNIVGEPITFTFQPSNPGDYKTLASSGFGVLIKSDGTNWFIAGCSLNCPLSALSVSTFSIGDGSGFTLDLSNFVLPVGMTKWAATWASIGVTVQNIGTPFLVPGASTIEGRMFTGGGIPPVDRGGALWVFPVTGF